MEEQFLGIRKYLDSLNVEYEVREHGPVYTSEEASRVRGEPLSSGVKALVFRCRDSKTSFVLALVSGDRKIDSRKLRELTNSRDVHLASPNEVLEICGCEIGSVHPFGLLMSSGLRTLMDKKILENERVNFNAGLHTVTITMKAEELKKAAKAEVADISA